MRVFVFRTSHGFFADERGAEREFDSLEDAIQTLIQETHHGAYIVSMGGPNGVDWTIEIYDDYRE